MSGIKQCPKFGQGCEPSGFRQNKSCGIIWAVLNSDFGNKCSFVNSEVGRFEDGFGLQLLNLSKWIFIQF